MYDLVCKCLRAYGRKSFTVLFYNKKGTRKSRP